MPDRGEHGQYNRVFEEWIVGYLARNDVDATVEHHQLWYVAVTVICCPANPVVSNTALCASDRLTFPDDTFHIIDRETIRWNHASPSVTQPTRLSPAEQVTVRCGHRDS